MGDPRGPQAPATAGAAGARGVAALVLDGGGAQALRAFVGHEIVISVGCIGVLRLCVPSGRLHTAAETGPVHRAFAPTRQARCLTCAQTPLILTSSGRKEVEKAVAGRPWRADRARARRDGGLRALRRVARVRRGRARARRAWSRSAARLERAEAVLPGGRALPVSVRDGRLTPREKIAPGQTVNVEVTLKRPGWSAWLIGDTQARDADRHRRRRRTSCPAGSPPATAVPVRFSEPVTTRVLRGQAVAASGDGAGAPRPERPPVSWVAVAARPGSRSGRPTRPLVPAREAARGARQPGARRQALARRADPPHVRRPAAEAASSTPRSAAAGAGSTATRSSSYPTGFGIPLGAHEKLTFAHSSAVGDADGRGLKTTRELEWTVPAGLDAPPAPAARPGGLPAAGLERRRGRRRPSARRPARPRCRRTGDVLLALRATRRPS